MGKAKRQLIQARKAFYEDVESESSDDSWDIEYEKHLEDQKIKNASIILREKLIQYADEGSWPLCEYLDLDNVDNFVKWVITCK
jgi:hypothetical protein